MHGETPYEIMFGKILNINQSKISFDMLELLCGRTLLIYTRYNALKQVYQMLLVNNLICNRIKHVIVFQLTHKKIIQNVLAYTICVFLCVFNLQK